jgi:hypothetical protein
VLKDVEKSSKAGKIDFSKVIDLYDEEGMLEEINPDDLVIEADEEEKKEN